MAPLSLLRTTTRLHPIVPVTSQPVCETGVGDGVGTTPAQVNMSVNARTDPVSEAALSLTFNVQLPVALWPSNAERGLFGANDPDGNAASVEAPH